MQKQIRFPPIVHVPDKVTDKRNMVRFHGSSQKRHICLFRSAVSFFIIAFHACCHQIFPRILTPARFRLDMIHRQRNITAATILTTMAIPPKDVLSRKNDLFIRNTDKNRKSHNAREGYRHRYRTNQLPVAGFNQLCFPQKQQYDCFLDIANT